MLLLIPFVALPLAAIAVICAVVVSTPSLRDEPRSSTPFRIGTGAWFALAGVSVVAALGEAGDWEHVWWSVQFPMLGLAASSGLFLAGSERMEFETGHRRPFALGSTALPAALATFFALGVLPLIWAYAFEEPSRPARATGHPLAALVGVFEYGFGGPVPTLMIPEVDPQIARGLGHPPREVTVPMGSTGVAALWIAILATLRLLARGLEFLGLREAVTTLVPLGAALAFFTNDMGYLRELWTNEPWLVQSYGPVLFTAAVSVLALAIALGWRPDHRRGTRASRSTGRTP